MMTLFVKTGCPFCKKVLAAAQELEISLEEKNVADPEVRAELVLRGGKAQTPFLDDIDCGVMLYESEEIIKYLRRRSDAGKEVCVAEYK